MGGVKSVRCFGDEVSDVKPISHMFTHLYTVWNWAEKLDQHMAKCNIHIAGATIVLMKAKCGKHSIINES